MRKRNPPHEKVARVGADLFQDTFSKTDMIRFEIERVGFSSTRRHIGYPFGTVWGWENYITDLIDRQ